MIGLALALILAAVHGKATAHADDWLKTIKMLDWTLLTANQTGTALVFGKPARGNLAAASPRIWIRVETATEPARSTVALTQFDCVGRRYTLLQTTGWTGNNMEGDPAPLPPIPDPPQWTSIAVGSPYGQVLEQFCPAP
jgi:hypothetical protein